VEATLKEVSTLPPDLFELRFGEFKRYEERKLSDVDYFRIMVEVVFYSGFKAGTVTKKLGKIREYFPDHVTVAKYGEEDICMILSDSEIIRNRRKIEAVIENARTFNDIILKYGSFGNYVKSFKPKESFENLMRFREDIKHRFEYLGDITAYHFMMDIGLPVIKPDRVLTRIFKRLGLIESEDKHLEVLEQAQRFSLATGYPLRYIDIIFVKYGQMGKDEYFGLEDGICLEKNPKCEICGIRKYCKYVPSVGQGRSRL